MLSPLDTSSPDTDPVTPTAPAELFERNTLRVSDLTGASLPPLRPARLIATWYDWGVIALIVSSLIAGVVCIGRGL